MDEQHENWFEEDMATDVVAESKLIVKQIIVSVVILCFITVRQLFNEQITLCIQNFIY